MANKDVLFDAGSRVFTYAGEHYGPGECAVPEDAVADLKAAKKRLDSESTKTPQEIALERLHAVKNAKVEVPKESATSETKEEAENRKKQEAAADAKLKADAEDEAKKQKEADDAAKTNQGGAPSTPAK